MRATRPAEQALRLHTSRSTQQYVCRACRAQAARQFHTSSRVLADEPFYKRLQKALFGSKESKEAEKSREEKQRRKVEELGGRDDQALEVKTDKRGRQYEVAAIIDPSVNKDYVQATTSAGLESVGSEAWVKQRADQGEQYFGFAPQKTMELSHGQWAVLLHHITVEVLTLQKAGRDVEQVCWPRGSSNRNTWQQTKSAKIMASVDGGITITFTQPDAKRQILQEIPSKMRAVRTQSETGVLSHLVAAASEGNESKRKASTAPAWMDMSLQDSSLKMAILKRILQLTGKRLLNPALTNAATVADFYNAYKTVETPKKLAQMPQLQRLSINAPNVKVYPRRQTPIDKDRSVGRWKVIEEELMKRDLPITGSRFQGARAGAY